MIIDIYSDAHIRIKSDPLHSLLLVNWVGRQTHESVRDGCMKILEFMTMHKNYDILNDNRHVIGDWSVAAEWVGATWLPLMKTAGLHKFAWVNSSLDLSRVSINQAVSFTDPAELPVRVYTDYNQALDWLFEEHINAS